MVEPVVRDEEALLSSLDELVTMVLRLVGRTGLFAVAIIGALLDFGLTFWTVSAFVAGMLLVLGVGKLATRDLLRTSRGSS